MISLFPKGVGREHFFEQFDSSDLYILWVSIIFESFIKEQTKPQREETDQKSLHEPSDRVS